MKKCIFYTSFAVVTLFLILSTVTQKDKLCSEDRSKQFVVVGGKYYLCSDNKVEGEFE